MIAHHNLRRCALIRVSSLGEVLWAWWSCARLARSTVVCWQEGQRSGRGRWEEDWPQVVAGSHGEPPRAAGLNGGCGVTSLKTLSLNLPLSCSKLVLAPDLTPIWFFYYFAPTVHLCTLVAHSELHVFPSSKHSAFVSLIINLNFCLSPYLAPIFFPPISLKTILQTFIFPPSRCHHWKTERETYFSGGSLGFRVRSGWGSPRCHGTRHSLPGDCCIRFTGGRSFGFTGIREVKNFETQSLPAERK